MRKAHLQQTQVFYTAVQSMLVRPGERYVDDR